MKSLKEFVLLTIIFPIADKLMGTCAMKWYGQIKLMNTWSKEQIDNWQNKQLQAFIRHAYDNTVYYKNLFDELGLTPDDIKTKEDLKKLPIINKDIVNKNYENLIPSNIKQIRYRKARTGGTTGEPMRYLCDENTWGYVTGAKIIGGITIGNNVRIGAGCVVVENIPDNAVVVMSKPRIIIK